MRLLSTSFAILIAQTTLALGPLTSVNLNAEVATERPAPATPSFAPEAVQAAFLLQFLRFTDWPEQIEKTPGPFVIAVAHHRALENELLRLAARETVRDRRLRIVRVRNPRDFEGAHLAWIRPPTNPTEGYPERVEDALTDLRAHPVLTISDTPGFLETGGSVLLFREQTNVRFAINLEPARQAGLTFNSRLLALARPPPPVTLPPSSP